MPHSNYPKGAGLGSDPGTRSWRLVDFDWTMQHGSRAQRREILRQLKMYRRQGVPGADDALRNFGDSAYQPAGTAEHRAWRVMPPGRAAFVVLCSKGATAGEILAQWPGAAVEVAHGN